MILPRVLIFGQPFNNRYGGGITLTNLFRGWDRDRIAVAATGHVMYHVTTDVCETYYQLGKFEFKWRFPFSIFQKKFPSGLIRFNPDLSSSSGSSERGKRHFFVNKIFYPALEWLGLYHSASSIILSEKFREWLSEFRPEILYLQVSTLDTILFAKVLHDYLKIPAVLHMMDDWPSTISKRGPFKRLWERRIGSELRLLLDRIDLCLSISDAMSEEYLRRYNKDFKAYHNPIDASLWKQYTKTNFGIHNDEIKVLYSGRIGTGVNTSILEILRAIKELNRKGINAKLYIQSPSVNSDLLKSISSDNNVVVNPVADYADLPSIYSNADILVIANDFDKESIYFLRYSMPTKASEFMISGTPILVYSHGDTAISKFFTENKCGCCVTEQDLSKLADAFTKLIDDENYRKELSRNAVMLACEKFDAKKVRSEFQQDLINICQSSSR